MIEVTPFPLTVFVGDLLIFVITPHQHHLRWMISDLALTRSMKGSKVSWWLNMAKTSNPRYTGQTLAVLYCGGKVTQTSTPKFKKTITIEKKKIISRPLLSAAVLIWSTSMPRMLSASKTSSPLACHDFNFNNTNIITWSGMKKWQRFGKKESEN